MTLVHQDAWLTIHGGDCRQVLATMAPASVQCVVTSPPYWGLRDYGVAGQLGLEDTPAEYVSNLVDVFREVRRVVRPDGTVWLNLGDSYAAKKRGSDRGWSKSRLTNPGSLQKSQAAALRDTGERHRGKGAGVKEKDLIGIPWRVAFALQDDGWYLRSDIIWSKTNPMPESVTDRPTKAHEYLFLLSVSPRYHYDADAIREPAEPDGRRVRAADQAELGFADVAAVRPIRDRFPSGWASGPGSHATIEHARGNRERSFASSGPVSELVLPGQQAAQHRPEREDLVPTGHNRRTVWAIPTQPYPGAHFATFPEALVEPCILAGCPEGGVVMDPFAGTGTVGLVAQRLSRRAVLVDLNPEYLVQLSERNRAMPLGLADDVHIVDRAAS